jgi:hypothetical protein
MNVLIDTKSQSVLYAEACKDVIVIDFLFSFLTLPIGTVIKILSKGSMVGSVGNLYKSVEELDETYVCSARAKQAFLTPTGGKLQIPEAPAAPQQPPCTEVCAPRAPTTACAPPHIVVHFGSDDAPPARRVSGAATRFRSAQQLVTAPFLGSAARRGSVSGSTARLLQFPERFSLVRTLHRLNHRHNRRRPSD